MNSGPEIVSEVVTVDDDGTETDITVHRHWGVEYAPGCVRWNPGHGSGVYVPYDEAEARADFEGTRVDRNPDTGQLTYPHARLVTRTETTTVVTTAWEESS